MEEERKEYEKDCAREEAKQRAAFMPHLWAVTERKIGRPIFIVAWTGQNFWRRADLPDGIEKMADDDQVNLIRAAGKRHFALREGSAGPFGKIVGYYYRQSFDKSWLLNTDGEILDRDGGRVRIGNYTLQLHSKPTVDISFLFKKDH